MKKLLGSVFIFFIACMLIYHGAKALAAVWPVLLIAGTVVAVIAVAVKLIRHNRSKW